MTVTSGSSSNRSSVGSRNDSPSSNSPVLEKKKDAAGTGMAKNLTGSGSDSGHSWNDGSGNAGQSRAGATPISVTPAETSIVSGASSTPVTINDGSGLRTALDKTPGAVDTTVTQKPAAGGTPAPTPVSSDLGTTITNGPRSDFSVVLAGQVGRRPDRSAARSNNFISLVGGQGGLGRRTSEAKRSLIGGV